MEKEESGYVNQFRLTTSRAIIRRPCITQHAAGGSAMLTPITKSGIRACCQLVMMAAKL